MTSCPNCGGELGAGANFCEHCGQPLGDGIEINVLKDPASGPVYRVQITAYIKMGWQTFVQYPLGFVGFSIIMAFFFLFFIFLQQKFILIALLLTAAITPLHTGFYLVSAKLLQRRPCLFADFFSGYHYFPALFLYGLLYAAISGLGSLFPNPLVLHLLFSLASLAFTLLFIFTPFLIFDRRLSLVAALDLSFRAVRRRWLQLLGFVLLLGLILAAGALALGIGIVVTLPWVSASLTAAYADLFGLQSQDY
jgi:hypothetical protein